MFAGDLNARVGRLCTVESHLGGSHGLDASRNDNGERLLQLCADHRLYLSSVSFRHKRRHLATWRPPNYGQSWTQIDHIAIGYRWRGCVQDCRSFWGTCLDSDHALVGCKLALRFCGRRKPRFSRLDISKLNKADVLKSYQLELSHRLTDLQHTGVEDQWASLCHAMYTSAEATCGTIVGSSDPWISENSLRLIDLRRDIPADHAHDASRTAIRRDLKRSLRADRENWWKKKAAEMEGAHATGNSRKLFQLIRQTGVKRLGVSENICEQDGTVITALDRRLARWVEHFQLQFNHLPATAQAVSERMVAEAPWLVRMDPLPGGRGT